RAGRARRQAPRFPNRLNSEPRAAPATGSDRPLPRHRRSPPTWLREDASALKRSLDRAAVEPLEADDDELRGAPLGRQPWPVEIGIEPGADRLHDETRIAAGQRGKSFQAQ